MNPLGKRVNKCNCVANAQGKSQTDKVNCVCSSGYEGNANKTVCTKKNTTNGGNTTNNKPTNTVTNTVEEHKHSWTESSRTDATCTTEGKVSYKCSGCKETKTETLNVKGHTPGTADSTGKIVCTVCGITIKEGTTPEPTPEPEPTPDPAPTTNTVAQTAE